MPRAKRPERFSKRLRRLDLSLPDDHPVWSYPTGERSRKVRELLDLALRFEQGFVLLGERLAGLKEALGRLEERLIRLEEMVAAGGLPTENERQASAGDNLPDPTSFLRAFG